MPKLLKNILCFSLIHSLVLSPTSAFAEFAAAKDLQELSAQEKIQDIYDLARPARKKETLSELYSRLIVRLDDQEQAFLSQKLGPYARNLAPNLSLKGDTIVISDKKQKLRITFEESQDKGTRILLNGKALTQNEIQSPGLRWSLLEKALSPEKPAKKSTLYHRLLIPRAEADILGMPVWTLVGVGAVILAGVVAYQKQKESMTTSCNDKTPSCCIVNDKYVMHGNACCQQITGGLGMGSGTKCPDTAPTAVPLSVPASSTQR